MSTRFFTTTSELNLMLTKVGTAMLKILGASWGGHVTKYRPEDHYMRGPGPKWRQKHGLSHSHRSNASCAD
jgi:hypothetical protein